MFMPNIPRRKIYETMLIYEDGMIELQIIFLNEKNFQNKKKEIHDILKKIEDSYYEIKSLFVLFLENKKFENQNDFENEVKKLIENKLEVNRILFENKTFRDDFKNSIKNVDELFSKKIEIKTKDELKKNFEILDIFNHLIPNILAIRRDKIQK